MKFAIMIVAMLYGVVAFGRTDREIITDICNTVVSCDLPPDECDSLPSSIAQLCADEIQELGVDEPGFWHKLEVILTNTVASVDVSTNAECAMIASGALLLFSEYGGAGASNVLAFVMTNAVSPSVAGEASVLFARKFLPYGGVDMYLSAGVRNAQSALKNELYGGLYAGFNARGGDVALTNRMIGVALQVIDDKWGCWTLSDRNVCRWWPDYSTSSNRLIAVESAILSQLPYISTNYLESVRSQLLALPDNAMQLLPTNAYFSAEL